MMFEYLGWMDEARAIDAAVRVAVREGQVTQDLGGRLGTRECGEWVTRRVAGSG